MKTWTSEPQPELEEVSLSTLSLICPSISSDSLTFAVGSQLIVGCVHFMVNGAFTAFYPAFWAAGFTDNTIDRNLRLARYANYDPRSL